MAHSRNLAHASLETAVRQLGNMTVCKSTKLSGSFSEEDWMIKKSNTLNHLAKRQIIFLPNIHIWFLPQICKMKQKFDILIIEWIFHQSTTISSSSSKQMFFLSLSNNFLETSTTKPLNPTTLISSSLTLSDITLMRSTTQPFHLATLISLSLTLSLSDITLKSSTTQPLHLPTLIYLSLTLSDITLVRSTTQPLYLPTVVSVLHSIWYHC